MSKAITTLKIKGVSCPVEDAATKAELAETNTLLNTTKQSFEQFKENTSSSLESIESGDAIVNKAYNDENGHNLADTLELATETKTAFETFKTSAESALDTKLTKVTRTHSVAGLIYGVMNDGSQTTFSLTTPANEYTVPYRLSDGTINVGTPTADTNATTKKYVDDKLTRAALIEVIGKATSSLDGVMSKEDKGHLDTLVALMKDDDNAVVDKIHEIIAIFNQYPEGTEIATTLSNLNTKIKNVEDNKVDTSTYNTKVGELETRIGSLESDITTKANSSAIPTKVSQLDNDSSYVTSSTLSGYNYATKTDLNSYVTNAIYTNEVNRLEDDIAGLQDEVGTKANTSALNDYAKKTDLNSKANSADVYTKTESDNTFQPKGNYLTEVPNTYATTSYVDTKTSDLISKTVADSSYQPKGDYLTSIPDTYATKKYVDDTTTDLITQTKASEMYLQVDGSNNMLTGLKMGSYDINFEYDTGESYDDILKIGYNVEPDGYHEEMGLYMQNQDGYEAYYSAGGFSIGNGGISIELDAEESRFTMEFPTDGSLTITPSSVGISKGGYSTFYGYETISRNINNTSVVLDLPGEDGKLALTKDIPNLNSGDGISISSTTSGDTITKTIKNTKKTLKTAAPTNGYTDFKSGDLFFDGEDTVKYVARNLDRYHIMETYTSVNLPIMVDGLSVASRAGVAYLFGGRYFNTNSGVYEFNMRTWSYDLMNHGPFVEGPRAPFTSENGEAITCEFDGAIYIFTSNNGGGEYRDVKQIWRYDPTKTKFTLLREFAPGALKDAKGNEINFHNISVANYGKYIYIVTKYALLTFDVISYQLAMSNWATENVYSGGCAHIFEHKLWVFGFSENTRLTMYYNIDLTDISTANIGNSTAPYERPISNAITLRYYASFLMDNFVVFLGGADASRSDSSNISNMACYFNLSTGEYYYEGSILPDGLEDSRGALVKSEDIYYFTMFGGSNENTATNFVIQLSNPVKYWTEEIAVTTELDKKQQQLYNITGNITLYNVNSNGSPIYGTFQYITSTKQTSTGISSHVSTLKNKKLVMNIVGDNGLVASIHPLQQGEGLKLTGFAVTNGTIFYVDIPESAFSSKISIDNVTATPL